MHKQEEVQEKLDQLEKELWYLVRKSLPDLRNELLNSGGDKSKIQELEQKINQTITKVEELETEINEQKTALQSLQSLANNNSQLINQISSEVQTNTNNIAQNAEDIQSNLNAISSNSTNISTMQGDINNINSNYSQLSNRVTIIENRPSSGGSGRVIETIFDMESTDENINKGFTEGMKGGKNITWTENYDKIRIFAKLVSAFAYVEVPLTKRPMSDFSMFAVPIAGAPLYFWKGTVNAEGKKMTVGIGFTYKFDRTAGTFTLEAGVKDNYIVTKVEGIKGV